MRWVLGLLAIMLVDSAIAEVPHQLHYNGYLTNELGEPVECPDPLQCDAPFEMTFRLYTMEEGGTPVWNQLETFVPIYQGSFHVLLGKEDTPLTKDLFDEPLWLAVKLEGQPEMSPRQSIVSAAYALRAGTVEQADNAALLGGMSPEDFASSESLTEIQMIVGGADDDTLAALGCAPGQVAKAADSAWICADAGESDTTLSEAQVDAMVANNGYAGQSELTAAQASLAELQTLLSDLETSIGLDMSAIQAQLDVAVASIATLDASLDPIAKAELDCGVGQSPQHNGSSWVCGHSGGTIPTEEPLVCDATTVGRVYFDIASNALRVCDGSAYRKVKLCSEICPDAGAVPCAQAIVDDCGSSCGGTGTGLNSNQCNEAVVTCGQPVLDGCSNDCGTTGLLLNTLQCPDPGAIACGQNTTDSCGNLCGQQGTQCLDPLAPFCDGSVCKGTQIVPHLNGRRWGDGTYAGSCKDYKNPPAGYDYGGAIGDGTYTIQAGGAIFDVYCDMSSADGGWTLVLMVQSGDFETFHYDSSYWTNTVLLNPDVTDPNMDMNMKNRAYDTLPFTEMRLAMHSMDNVMHETVSSSSAHALFTGGPVPSPHSRSDFLAWIPLNADNWNNQPHCNETGFQRSAPKTNCRYGLLMNNETDCISNDSAVGFGCHSQDYYPNRTHACGGHHWEPNVAHHYQGWILVR